MDKIDWTSFKKRIVIHKPVEEIYAAWSIPEKISTWFLEKADYTSNKNQLRHPKEGVETGDKFTWKWHNWNIIETGEILSANGKDFISFTFGDAGQVSVQINSHPAGSELLLLQEEIPVDEKGKKSYYVGCSNGWTFWLTNLKAWLEHGILLNATGLEQNETSDLVNS